MGYVGHITEKEFQNKINHLQNEMVLNCGMSFSLDPFMNDAGAVHRDIDMFTPVSVDIREPSMIILGYKHRLLSEEPIMGYRTKDFLKVLYAIKHEERHVQQYKAIGEGKSYDDLTDDKIPYIAKEVLAMTNNGTYYHQGYMDPFYDNGSHMLMELDAQQYAIRSLYNYCEKEYGKDKAEKLVFDVITSELNVVSDFRKSGKDYIEIPLDKIVYDEKDEKWCIKDLTCKDILDLYGKEINRAPKENRRRYITKNIYSRDEISVYKGEGSIERVLQPKDMVFEWLVSNLGDDFNFAKFPSYFETSDDTDKFVIAVTNRMLKQKGIDVDLKYIVETTDCIKDESFVWNEQIFIDMFQNEKPNHQFSFDKYKMKQDLERRLQTVQDSAEEKGLATEADVDIEREVRQCE